MLSDICRVHLAACGRLQDGAYWLIGPGSAGLAQGCRCALPLQGAGAYCGGLAHSYRLLILVNTIAIPTAILKSQLKHCDINGDNFRNRAYN